MQLSTEEIKKLSRLAHLALSDEQVAEFSTQLNSILDYVAQLQAVDTHAINATTHMVQADTQVLRDDTVEACTQMVHAHLLASVPKLQDNFIKVPKVL